jgi:tRNA uridine 5-carbamoylmethylation protein Kti12
MNKIQKIKLNRSLRRIASRRIPMHHLQHIKMHEDNERIHLLNDVSRVYNKTIDRINNLKRLIKLKSNNLTHQTLEEEIKIQLNRLKDVEKEIKNIASENGLTIEDLENKGLPGRQILTDDVGEIE